MVNAGIARLHHPVTALGPGRRAGVWFQGCSIRCDGCMSRDTWAPAGADRVAVEVVTSWLAALPAGEVDGVTVSGGEPFDQPVALIALTSWVRGHFGPGVDVLVYTGYTERVVRARYAAALTAIDVLVTEPYRPALGPALRWRGSANQQMIPLTQLGHRRYVEHVDAPADTRLQVDASNGAVHLIGIPRPGDLARLERGLAERGVTIQGASWCS